MIDRPLVAEEAERLVAAEEMGNIEGSAHRAAKLVAMERIDDQGAYCGLPSEGIGGVEGPVTHKLKHVAVILLGAALGDDIDHGAGVLAVLRAVVVGLYAEFLQRIGHGERLIDVGVLVHVVAAVEHVVGLAHKRAVGRNGNR